MVEDERNEVMAPKSFSAPSFSHIPFLTKSREEIEILIRKHRVDELSKRLVMGDYEQENDADLRSPSPRPVYDSKTGLRVNTRDIRLKEKHIREK